MYKMKSLILLVLCLYCANEVFTSFIPISREYENTIVKRDTNNKGPSVFGDECTAELPTIKNGEIECYSVSCVIRCKGGTGMDIGKKKPWGKIVIVCDKDGWKPLFGDTVFIPDCGPLPLTKKDEWFDLVKFA